MAKRPRIEPEFQSLESFLEFICEEERTEFTHDELMKLAYSLRKSHQALVKELQALGLNLARRPHERKVRGHRSNDHDRWSAYPSHGGSGFDNRE